MNDEEGHFDCLQPVNGQEYELEEFTQAGALANPVVKAAASFLAVALMGAVVYVVILLLIALTRWVL